MRVLRARNTPHNVHGVLSRSLLAAGTILAARSDDDGRCNAWILHHMGDCVGTPREYVAFACGLASMAAWSLAELPQIIANYQNGESEAMSYGFISSWIFGDILNVWGCILIKATATQTLVAVLYLGVTVLLFLQHVWYNEVKPRLTAASQAKHAQPARLPSAEIASDIHEPLLPSATEPPQRPTAPEHLPGAKLESGFVPDAAPDSGTPDQPPRERVSGEGKSQRGLLAQAIAARGLGAASPADAAAGEERKEAAGAQPVAAQALQRTPVAHLIVGSWDPSSRSPGDTQHGSRYHSSHQLSALGGVDTPGGAPWVPDEEWSAVGTPRDAHGDGQAAAGQGAAPHGPHGPGRPPLPPSAERRRNSLAQLHPHQGSPQRMTLMMTPETLRRLPSRFQVDVGSVERIRDAIEHPEGAEAPASTPQAIPAAAAPVPVEVEAQVSARSLSLRSFRMPSSLPTVRFVMRQPSSLAAPPPSGDAPTVGSAPRPSATGPGSLGTLGGLGAVGSAAAIGMLGLLGVAAVVGAHGGSWGDTQGAVPGRRLLREGAVALGLTADEWGAIMGWVMTGIYLSSRVPQILRNIARGSVEGLSLSMFSLAIVGNATYALQILVRDSSWAALKHNLPWITDCLVCLVLDFIILGQFLTYSLARGADGAGQESLDEALSAIQSPRASVGADRTSKDATPATAAVPVEVSLLQEPGSAGMGMGLGSLPSSVGRHVTLPAMMRRSSSRMLSGSLAGSFAVGSYMSNYDDGGHSFRQSSLAYWRS